MDKFPLTWEGRHVGELTLETEPLYTWFTARCRLPGEGLWCAWAVGDRGELRLGVLEPQGDRAVIRRRFSRAMTAPVGKPVRGEVRPAGGSGVWEEVAAPDTLFRTPWLRHQLRGVSGAMTGKQGNNRLLALPYDPAKPFPLPPLFCLARVRMIRGKPYVVYAFDEKEWPVPD